MNCEDLGKRITEIDKYLPLLSSFLGDIKTDANFTDAERAAVNKHIEAYTTERSKLFKEFEKMYSEINKEIDNLTLRMNERENKIKCDVMNHEFSNSLLQVFVGTQNNIKQNIEKLMHSKST